MAAKPERSESIWSGPTIVALLRDLVGLVRRVEGHLATLVRRDQAKLNTLDRLIRDADANLPNTARPEGATMTDPNVTVDQVVTDFTTFRDDVAAAILALQDALANVTIPPAAQTALNNLDAAIKAADQSLPTPPPTA